MKGRDSSVQPLGRDEWDFSRVPERELEACFTWECAREWEPTSEIVYEFERKVEDGRISSDDGRRYTNIQNVGMLRDLACRLDEPWQELEQKVRSSAARRLSSIFFETGNVEGENLALNPPWRGIAQHAVCFMVDFRAADSQLIEEFAEWLAETRRKPPVETRGSNPRDRLKMLGAMRLLHHYPLEEAMKITEQTLGKPLYGQRTSWARARRGALDAFRTRFLEDWMACGEPPKPKSHPKWRTGM